MFRHPLALASLTLLAACGDPAVPAPTEVAPSALRAAQINNPASPFDIAVIGDAPYGDEALARFPALIDAINADRSVRLAVHIGDIKSGSTVCSDAWFDEIARQFARFDDPLVYAIGDNEWTDCHRENNGGYDPLERLDRLRTVFFPRLGHTLGGQDMRVDARRAYPENQLWVQSRVTLATLHVVGSNNGLEPWFGGRETPAQTAARVAEVTARNRANLAWVDRVFATARTEPSAGVVLFFQADFWSPAERAAGARYSGHTALIARIAQRAAAYGRPVLLVAGDSHDYREDPGVPWFTLYGVTPPPNVTQLIVDRSIEEDVNWVRIRINPTAPRVFSWSEVVVP